MKKKIQIGLMTASLVLMAGAACEAQTSSYFQAMTNLSPTGYWPMHESGPGVAGDVETNLGSLGSLGNGFYSDWIKPSTVMLRNQPGALAGDTDPSVVFGGPVSALGTNYLIVPHTSPQATLVPPFSLEAWAKPTTENFGDIIGVGNGEALNGNGGGNRSGIRLSWGTGSFQFYYANGTSAGNTGSFGEPNGTHPDNQWYHLVLTYDTSSNVTVYVNGVAVGALTQGNIPVAIDSWSPISIGAGLWQGSGPVRPFIGPIDEVAIYTNLLSASQVLNHYNTGTNAAPTTSYKQTILNDTPIIYFRMDAPTYAVPAIANWPVMTNYGSASGNGVYAPGVIPGNVPAPTAFNGLTLLTDGNTFPGNGLSSFADAGAGTAYNATGTSAAFSVTALYKTDPADARTQTICSHGTNSWQITLSGSGQIKFNAGTGQAAGNGVGDLTSAGFNDGKWHQIVAVHNFSTNVIYIDGALTASNVFTNTLIGNSLHVMMGADPSYTNNPAVLGRQFAGNVSDVAFFSGVALTGSQVQSLFSALGEPVNILTQPISATANQNAGFTNTVVATGSSPLSYQWYKNNVALGIQTNAALVLNPVQPSDASTNYYVVVTNIYGSITSAVVTLTVQTSPVFVSQTPQPYTNLFTLFTGTSPTFAVSALGAAPLFYQWVVNGSPVSLATNSSFTIPNIGLGFTTVDCVVSNSVGSTNSMVWSASVVAQPTAPYPQAVLAANPIAYWRLNESDDGNSGIDGNDGAISHDYAGGNDGIYTNVSLGQNGYNQNSDPNTHSAEFGETGISFVDSYSGHIAGIDFTTPTNKNAEFSIEAWVNGFSGTQINGAGIVSKGYGNGGEQFDLDLITNQFRFFVRDAGGGVRGSTSTNKVDGNWHHVVGVCDEVNSNISLYVDGVLVLQNSVAPGSGIQPATNLMSIGSRMSAANTNNNFQFDGYINDVAIYNYALSSNQVLSHFLSAGIGPTFVQTPPASVTLNGGGTLVLPAVLNGTPPITYSWADQNGGTNIVTGSTNGSPLNAGLTISNLPGSFNGDTLVLSVNNAAGSLSYSVQLTVITNPPTLTEDIASQVVLVPGKAYDYAVATTGPTPISYQWYNGASPIVGQTNATYVLTAGGAGSGSTYYVVATNQFGGTTSTVSTVTVVAQLTDSYASSILQFNPAGYWPLQETAAPAPIAMETNYGSLGKLGNAYYAITTANQPRVTFQQSGALAGDPDPAVQFSNPSGTNYAFVPRTTPAVTLRPPFTLEVWMNSGSQTFADLISESGNGLDAAVGAGNWGGPRLSYAGNNGGGPALQLYLANGNGTQRNFVGTAANTLTLNSWHHCVASYDGSNTVLYVDGAMLVNDSTTLAGTNTMAIDTWSPLTIGDGLWQGAPTRGYTGSIDEVAIYTNILTPTQVGNHYAAGTTSGSNYMQTVLTDNPLLYYRMDCAGYTNENPNLYPVAVNYGSASPEGDYQPGIVPGGLSGPPNAALGSNSVSAPIDGVLSAVDVGNDPSFNPSGRTPFTAMTWFRCYPSDVRSQAIMGHGNTNWAMNLDGTSGRIIWNTYAGGQVTSTNVLNDGNWHFAAGVSDGTTSSLYVDGTLNNSAALAAGLVSESSANLYLGGDSDFVIVGSNERYFGGAIAQAAFFTSALNASQIQQIYNAAVPAVVAPTIHIAASGNNVVITYTGVLRSSVTANGPYAVVAGAMSPYNVPASAQQQFYRASSQ